MESIRLWVVIERGGPDQNWRFNDASVDKLNGFGLYHPGSLYERWRKQHAQKEKGAEEAP